ncbi:MAG: 6,7-dimethyl-8-ribityllumazine synthase [Gammaproteobacteria bacterium SG8_31]|jgi:6,7-dimethyl-8-ribityllumazine synthase|nr:MAG: 6,7-dimethyl-8-ribityllumazine synthase [Gammaproteobacteria bacterium SG8_31]
MKDINVIEGEMIAKDLRVGIVASRFNEFIVESLVRGAVDALVRHGVRERDITLVRVPGAWEMPMAVKRMAARQRFDVIVALGAVIRGATPHFDYVAGECAKGIAQAAHGSDVPVAFGVLTTDTIEQAIERAGTKSGNKGAEAAMSAIEMANVLRQLGN